MTNSKATTTKAIAASTTTSVSERIALAKQLSALKNEKKVTGSKMTEEQKAALDALNKVKMPHPFVAGKMVSARYFGEIFPAHGVTLNDWIQAEFVPVEVHETALAELAELKEKAKATKTVAKSKK